MSTQSIVFCYAIDFAIFKMLINLKFVCNVNSISSEWIALIADLSIQSYPQGLSNIMDGKIYRSIPNINSQNQLSRGSFS